ncbi:MAG: ISSpo8, transposase [Rhizobium sp.]|nr:ISSpo8, transposase [Rhizobium sp.]
MFNLTHEIYNDADKAREHLEAIHWPNGPVCPTCGNCDPERITKLMGKSTRPGVYKCKECRSPFTVTVGTVFERSKIALNKWVLAAHLMAASKKGMSAHQLHRMLGVTYKTAWFMAHRIREAMKENHATPMGGDGKTVEADETYIGKRETPPVLSRGRIAKPTKSGKAGGAHKRVVVGLVERGGQVRTFHINHATKETVKEVLDANVSKETNLYTDESRLYKATGKEYADHQTTKHSGGEYVRYDGDKVIHTNTIENVFSVFKRGMIGVYQHCGEAHLHRYLVEFDFRYNRRAALKVSDAERAEDILRMARDKRLTYRRFSPAVNA